jgi:shikimate kinase
MATAASIPSKIFLTGLMGSGKSYWGRQLAARFRVPFLDLDKGIEMAERSSIADIFATKGEEYFRAAERDILQVLMEHPKFVMSCGGGTPCYFNNMAAMKNNGTVVWLNPPLETLSERLMPGRLKRPLIRSAETEEDIAAILIQLLEKRKPFYEMSDYVVDTPHPTFETFENLLLQHA